ncbi:NAD(P)H-binding protein [Bacteroidota bacterium]
MKKNVIITGATGMTGSLVLQECLSSSEIEKATSIARHPSGITHEKLTEIIHNDFTDFSTIEAYFKNQDIAYYCIGVYSGTVPREEFSKITVDFTKAFAEKLKKHNPAATFCFLSGQGADQSEKSHIMFARDKGIAENFLINQKFGQTYIFRPAYIYPVSPRKEPNVGYRITRALYPVLKRIYPKGVITSKELAHAIFNTGLKGGNKTIIENQDIKRISLLM